MIEPNRNPKRVPAQRLGSAAPPGSRARRLLLTAGISSVLTALSLIAIKVWAWRVTDSIAMLSSLVDSSLDLVAAGITLLAIRVSLEPPDSEHRFGHGKSEGIAGLVQGIIILGSGLFVAARAVQRLLAPSAVLEPALGGAVIIVSLILTCGLIVLQRYVIKHTGSLAVAADTLHYEMDLLTSLAVLVAILMSAQFGLDIFDPILGLLIAAYILYSVREIIVKTLNVLLDHELPEEDRERIEAIAFAHPDVRGVHDVRTRSAGPDQFVQLHIELAPSMPLQQVHDISDQIERELRRVFPRAEVLIHADPYGLTEARDRF